MKCIIRVCYISYFIKKAKPKKVKTPPYFASLQRLFNVIITPLLILYYIIKTTLKSNKYNLFTIINSI
jgi:hypothetical protein